MMDIMELIDEVVRQRVDAEMDFNTYYPGYERDMLTLESRIKAMQEVVDAVDKGDMSKYDYDLIKAMIKYKETVK